jgi:hypothetical protein
LYTNVVAKIEEQEKRGFIGTVLDYQSETSTKLAFPRDEHDRDSKDSQEV